MRTIDQITKDLQQLAINTSFYIERTDQSNEDPIYIESRVINTKKALAALALFGAELRMYNDANPAPDFKQGGIISGNEDAEQIINKKDTTRLKINESGESKIPTPDWA